MRPLLHYLLPSQDRMKDLAEQASYEAQQHGIQLHSTSPSKKSNNRDSNVDNLQPKNNNLSRKTEVTAGKSNPDPERDEGLLEGIHVQEDVRIDRTLV